MVAALRAQEIELILSVLRGGWIKKAALRNLRSRSLKITQALDRDELLHRARAVETRRYDTNLPSATTTLPCQTISSGVSMKVPGRQYSPSRLDSIRAASYEITMPSRSRNRVPPKGKTAPTRKTGARPSSASAPGARWMSGAK